MPLFDLFNTPYDEDQKIKSDALGLQKTQQDIQQAQAVTANTQAQLGGYQGDSMSRLAKGNEDQATLGSSIEAKNAANRLSTNQSQATDLVTTGQKLGQAGAMLQSIPSFNTPAGNSRVLALHQLAQQYGIPTDHPVFQELSQMDPENIPKALQTLGTNLAMSDSKFQGQRAIEQDKTQASLTNNENTTQAKITAAQIAADARVQSAQLMMQRMQQHMSLEQRLSQLLQVPADQRDQNWSKNYSDTYKTVVGARQAAANNYLGPEIMSGQAATTPGQRTDSTINDVTGGSKPSQSGGPSQEQVKAAGFDYEPNKYKYRLGPNGQIQRAPI